MEQTKENISKWLKMNFMSQSIVQEIYIIGSFTHKELKHVRDIDIVQILYYTSKSEAIKFIKKLKLLKDSFKEKFGKELHITSFNQKETADFIHFMALNQYIKIL